ncbi:MAG TPA: pilin [Candidatus Paceibacterota bacterium]|jgi:hypothetical protein
MTLTLARNLSLTFVLLLMALGPVAKVEAATCTPACTGNTKCYTIQDVATKKSTDVCRTPAQYAAYQKESAAAVNKGEQTATGRPNTIGSEGKSDGMLTNPLKVDSIEELLDIVLKAVVRIGSIILVLALVWVGFLFVAARGNPEGVSKARTAFFWTIIGGLILLGATAISGVIQSTAKSLGA